MKKEDAIKYLQQLYPNGGHCWLDEQRIEAIGMAIQALQEEPVSEDLEDAAYKFVMDNFGNPKEPLYKFDQRCFKAGAQWQEEKDKSVTKDLGDYINELSKQFPEVSFAKLSRIAVRVAKWQKEQLMKDAIECKVDWYDGFLLDYTQEQQDGLLEKIGADVGDKVRVIVIKED